ncbi:DNA-binding response regulator [Priestia aryabhattai]|uniref:response regulator n=1 Tax=Bacillaceae TaxID=186817 RepID=UPI000BA089A2|nr:MULTISPECIES: response regulator [Bacillaceae]MDT2047972.1 response regulator [Priestia flexa]OZT11722.1 DNA-binding response regulator [Priestia aryabhattai]TDB53103.1 response regulator [Bacillus sp. CBEL-1]USY55942.1 response regulator [Bacillus sp. 1780r2a1]
MLKVAIAEDDFRIAQVQERFLQEIENVKVVGKALNAKDAIEMLEQENIDLLILDIYMPDEMGTDLLPRIRERFPKVDVIVVTAATEKDILERCLRNGVVNYLIKPVKMESFIEAIEGYQKKRRLLQARDEVDQSFVNSYFGYDKQQTVEKVLPSGIDGITLKRVKAILKDLTEGITIEEMGKTMGVSRTTARRYLEYLVSVQECHVQYDYGIVGRPERKYHLT